MILEYNTVVVKPFILFLQAHLHTPLQITLELLYNEKYKSFGDTQIIIHTNNNIKNYDGKVNKSFSDFSESTKVMLSDHSGGLVPKSKELLSDFPSLLS